MRSEPLEPPQGISRAADAPVITQPSLERFGFEAPLFFASPVAALVAVAFRFEGPGPSLLRAGSAAAAASRSRASRFGEAPESKFFASDKTSLEGISQKEVQEHLSSASRSMRLAAFSSEEDRAEGQAIPGLSTTEAFKICDFELGQISCQALCGFLSKFILQEPGILASAY